MNGGSVANVSESSKRVDWREEKECVDGCKYRDVNSNSGSLLHPPPQRLFVLLNEYDVDKIDTVWYFSR